MRTAKSLELREAEKLIKNNYESAQFKNVIDCGYYFFNRVARVEDESAFLNAFSMFSFSVYETFPSEQAVEYIADCLAELEKTCGANHPFMALERGLLEFNRGGGFDSNVIPWFQEFSRYSSDLKLWHRARGAVNQEGSVYVRNCDASLNDSGDLQTGLRDIRIADIAEPREPHKLIVLLGGDRIYFQHFFPYVYASIKKELPNSFVHVHLGVEDSIEANSLIERAKTQGGDVNISYEIMDPPSNRSRDWEKSYYTCLRFLSAPTFLSRYNKPLLITEMDATIASRAQEYIEKIGNADIAVSVQDKPNPWQAVSAQATFLNNTDKAFEFATRLRTYLRKKLTRDVENYKWSVDQAALYACWHRFRQERQGTQIAAIDKKRIIRNAGGNFQEKKRKLGGN